MDEYRNRSSPRLQFSKEELEGEQIASLVTADEEIPDAHDAIREKLRKRPRMRQAPESSLSQQSPIHDRYADNSDFSHPDPDRVPPDAGTSSEPLTETNGVLTDPRAPAVQNTRQKPRPQSATATNGSTLMGAPARDAPIAKGDQQIITRTKNAPYARAYQQAGAPAKDAPIGKGSQRAGAPTKDAPITQAESIVTPEAISPADAKKKAARLRFDEPQAGKPSMLSHTVKKTVRTAGDQLHRQVAKSNEDENVAVEAVLRADTTMDTALQMGDHAYHARSMRHAKQAEKTKRQFHTESIRTLETRQRAEDPTFSSNPISRWQQRRAIRSEYAKAKREGAKKGAQQTAKGAEKAAEKVGDAASAAVETVRKHPTVLIILALGAMLMIVMSSLQSCTPLAQSVLESIVIGTYPAEEDDVRAAERAYLAKERTLKDEMDHYERYHPGYDEYHVEADEIWHNPYVLIAIISAYYDGQDWDIDSAYPVIEKYFKLQYVVSETISTETRYRTETVTDTRTVIDPDTGRSRTETYTHEADVPYTYRICNVTLTNNDLSHLPVLSMSHHTMGMYALYMATHGNMEGIFSGPHATPLKDPMLYDIPQETLDADPRFAQLMEEANKYVGYPYVWGGASPETSFDCSGFVSYVFTNSGVYNTGRLGAKGLRSLCRDVPVDQVQPGDIVFFAGTMGEGVDGITHCGIYVGNNMMIHCGSPLGYADLNDSYWRQHFHSFGRVPY